MMKVTEQRRRLTPDLAAPAVKALARQLLAFALGMLCARGVVFGKYAPFGVAAVAAAPYPMLWSALLGAAFGYLLPGAAVVPVHYIAGILAAAAIRWTLSDLLKFREHPLFAPVTALLPALCTGLAVAFVNGSTRGTVALYVAEALLAGGAAYFFAQTSAAVRSGKGIASFTAQELTCAVLSLGMLALSLDGLRLGGVSLGRVLAVLGVLFAARYGGVAGGGVCGIAAGVVFSLSTPGLNYLSGAYALGGLMAGVFSPLGRLVSALAFIVSNGVASLQVGNQAAVINGLYEVLAATVIYMLLPARVGGSLAGIFSRGDDRARTDGLRRSVIMRLDYAAKALGDVSETVEEVGRKLEDFRVPDVNAVFRRAADEACRNCGLKVYCWERNYNDTMGEFNNLSPRLQERGEITRDDFSAQFSSHCSRLPLVTESVNRNYRDFKSREAVEGRVKQIRAMVADQFTTASRMLEDMAGELELFEKFDFVAAQRVTEVLRSAAILPIDVSCRIDRFERMSVEIEAAQVERARLNRAELTREIGRACGRVFEQPCVSNAQGKCRLQMSERPSYRVLTGFAQHCCHNGRLCGDSGLCFQDGCGRTVAVISDGMGSGGRAAVDGAMASGLMKRLVQAGIGFDTALKIVNSALLAKSGDESLATLDVLALDLYSGSAEFRKAGAPISVVRKAGKAVRLDAPSLPIGILNDINFAKKNDALETGDLAVLVSDGALAAGEDWLLEAVEQWEGRVPQELAEELVTQAIARRKDGHDDDITVLVLRLDSLKKAAS